jgi:hypothetical protein
MTVWEETNRTGKDREAAIYSLHNEANLSKIRIAHQTYMNTVQGDAMTKPTIQDLLKKINYIEADIDIRKQILYAIPSDQRSEMEKTIAIIAAKKQEIETLRQQILESDPEEYARIIAFEKVIAEFKQLAATRKFTSIIGRNINEQCALAFYDGTSLECLIKACDDNGDWTVITLNGELKHFSRTVVAEKPAASPIH